MILQAIGLGLGLFGQSKQASATAQSASNSIFAAEQSRLAALATSAAAADTRSAADTNYQIAQYNASSQRSNTLAGIEIDSLANDLAFGSAKTNMELALLDAKARSMNAGRIRQFAESRTTSSRKELRRQKRAFDQFEGRQKALVGGSGVAFEGSVLDVMAESAGQMQLTIQDMHEQANLERSRSYGDASLEDYGAQTEESRARFGYQNAFDSYTINNQIETLGRISADQAFHSAQSVASNKKAMGYSNAAGMQLSAAGQAYGTASQYSNASAGNQKLGILGGIFTGAAGIMQNRYTAQQKGFGSGNTPYASARPVGGSIFR